MINARAVPSIPTDYQTLQNRVRIHQRTSTNENLIDTIPPIPYRIPEIASNNSPHHHPMKKTFLIALVGILPLTSNAATLVQTFDYNANQVLIDSANTGTGDTSYTSAPSTNPSLTAQPFDTTLGTLESFTVSFSLNYSFSQTSGPVGTSVTGSAGGQFSYGGFTHDGTGNGSGAGGPPNIFISGGFPIAYSRTFLVSESGVIYDPNILATLSGTNPFDVVYEHGAQISPSEDAVNFQLSILQGSSISLTYNYLPIPEPSTALLGALGMMALLRRRR